MRDVYLLDKNLRTVHIFDTYVSLIWSKRYVENGDCELYIPASAEMIELVQIGYYLKRPDDDMVCVIRKIQLTTGEDGNYLIITGKDVRSFLDQRAIMRSDFGNASAEQTIFYILNDTVSFGVDTVIPGRGMFKADGSPLFQTANAQGLDGTWNTTFAHEIAGNKIREILKAFGWGWKMYIDPTDSARRIWTLVYKGVDHSADVIFSPDYENLFSTDYSVDAENAENAALTYAEDETAESVYRFVGVGAGVDRYEKSVKVSGVGSQITYKDLTTYFPGGTLVQNGSVWDYTLNPATVVALPGSELEFSSGWEVDSVDGQAVYVSTGPVVMASMDTDSPVDNTKVTMAPVLKNLLIRQRGMEAISGNEVEKNFEAVIDPTGTFKYGTDFNLGDIVTIRNEYGLRLPGRIVEVVEVEDQNGYSCQPKIEYTSAGEVWAELIDGWLYIYRAWDALVDDGYLKVT